MTHCPHTDPCRALAVAALSDPLHIELLMSRPQCAHPCPASCPVARSFAAPHGDDVRAEWHADGDGWALEIEGAVLARITSDYRWQAGTATGQAGSRWRAQGAARAALRGGV